MQNADRHILVVEDSVVLAQILKNVLQSAGFQVAFAANGREAWEAVQSTEYDLIITDHQMPEMSGIELCQVLRGSERFADIPIVLTTAKGFELDTDRLQAELDITAVFIKPFRPLDVLQVVESAVGKLTL